MGDEGDESRKYATIAQTFLFKAMDCIYLLRCPGQIPDFSPDAPFGFSLEVPSSESLRQPLRTSTVHGWFKIDISVSNTAEIIERWYLMHLRIDRTEPPPTVPGGPKGLKVYTYRSLCKTLRSIYSLLCCLPATSFAEILAQFTILKRNLVASCSPFEKFPLKLEAFCEEEVGQIKFGPVVTPVGKILVICEHRLDLTSLIPRAIRTAPHYTFAAPEPPPAPPREHEFGPSAESDSMLQLTPLPRENLSSFIPDSQLDGFIVVDTSMQFPEEESSEMPIGEFMRLIDTTESRKPGEPPSATELLEGFAHMRRGLVGLVSEPQSALM
jgi:hypothetical protein